MQNRSDQPYVDQPKLSAVSNCPVSNCPPTWSVSNCPWCQIVPNPAYCLKVFFQPLGPWPLILLGVSPAESVAEKGNCSGGDRMQIMGINEATKWDSRPNLQPGRKKMTGVSTARLFEYWAVWALLKSDRLGCAKPPFMPLAIIPRLLLLHSKRHLGRAKILTFSPRNRLLFRNALKALKVRFLLKRRKKFFSEENVATAATMPENRWRLKGRNGIVPGWPWIQIDDRLEHKRIGSSSRKSGALYKS